MPGLFLTEPHLWSEDSLMARRVALRPVWLVEGYDPYLVVQFREEARRERVTTPRDTVTAARERVRRAFAASPWVPVLVCLVSVLLLLRIIHVSVFSS
jgi:hypothetical protein